jgi:hypothetical protein
MAAAKFRAIIPRRQASHQTGTSRYPEVKSEARSETRTIAALTRRRSQHRWNCCLQHRWGQCVHEGAGGWHRPVPWELAGLHLDNCTVKKVRVHHSRIIASLHR